MPDSTTSSTSGSVLVNSNVEAASGATTSRAPGCVTSSAGAGSLTTSKAVSAYTSSV